MQVNLRHWIVALSAAVLGHTCLVVFFYEHSEQSAGARAAGLNGIEIALGAAGGSPGVANMETVSAEIADAVQRPDAVEPAEEVTPEPMPEVNPDPKVEAKPAPVQEQKPLSEPKLAATASSPLHEQALETPTESKAMPIAQTSAVSPSAVAQKQSDTLGNNGKNGAKERQESGDGDTGAGGGVPGAKRDYFTLLSAWLEQHKQYPSRAQRRRQEGTVYLRFVVDREGNVLSYQIERSSGYRLLDSEVEKMIRRAAPLPKMPNELMEAQLELVLPVSFYMR